MTLFLHRRGGARKKTILRERLPIIIEELGVATPERLRQRYRAKYGEPVGWNTVARYLRRLTEEGVITEQVATAGKGRSTVLYRLAR